MKRLIGQVDLKAMKETLRREAVLELQVILYLPIARGNDLDRHCLYVPSMIYFHSHLLHWKSFQWRGGYSSNSSTIERYLQSFLDDPQPLQLLTTNRRHRTDCIGTPEARLNTTPELGQVYASRYPATAFSWRQLGDFGPAELPHLFCYLGVNALGDNVHLEPLTILVVEDLGVNGSRHSERIM